MRIYYSLTKDFLAEKKQNRKTVATRQMLLLLAAFSSCFVFSACTKRNEPLELQNLSMNDLSPRIEWVLVTDPYVACRKEADYESETVASLRKGEIYEIKGNRTITVDDTKELWYALEDGWIPAHSVRVFSNKLKAQNARNNWQVK